jgi:MFS family permease
MYATGIPLGFITDRKGPHLNTFLGAFAIAGGYWPLRTAYMAGKGSMGLFTLVFFSFLTGMGSCGAFSAAIKTAAINWPLHRGTATAFPLAAFGLSAFFFTGISGIFFPGSTSSYLLLLCIGTFLMVFLPAFFIYVPHADEYHALSTSEHDDPPRSNSNSMVRPTSWRSKIGNDDAGKFPLSRYSTPYASSAQF